MNQLEKINPSSQIKTYHQNEFTKEQKDLIKSTICVGASDDELQYFFYVCQKTGLDPFTKQIYSVARWDKNQGRNVRAIQTGIDGLRVIANRSGELEGIEGPLWCGKDGVWKDVWLEAGAPVAAMVKIWRKNCRTPFTGVAKFDTFVQTDKYGAPSTFWKRMPEIMIGKVAEAMALRRAFPHDLSAVYSEEEMSQADSEPRAFDVQGERVEVVAKAIQDKFTPPEAVVSVSTPQEFDPECNPAIVEKIPNRDYVIPGGSLAGRRLCEVSIDKIEEMVLNVRVSFSGKTLNDTQKVFLENIESYVKAYHEMETPK